MEKIFSETIESVKQGLPVVWAVIANQSGSSPRSLGSRMIIRSDGSIAGSIGGGRLEADVLNEAKSLFSSPRRSLLHFKLTGKDAAETDMICGGLVDILLEPLRPDDASLLPFLYKIQEVIRGKGLLITSLTAGAVALFGDAHLLLKENGTIFGGLPVNPEELKAYLPTQTSRVLCGQEGTPALLVEPVMALPMLYIFGGGHVSLYLARLARTVDFRIAVMDDRPEFANPDRFPFADEILLRPYDRAIEGLSLDENAYVVIVTRGHLHDLEVLRQVIKSEARYIGMIGSRQKKNLIFKKLLEEGVPQQRLDQVYAPIGLNINAETPAEIAVSIVAELIRIRTGKQTRYKDWKV
jgi:xanthine dehydrogenase accessory factor